MARTEKPLGKRKASNNPNVAYASASCFCSLLIVLAIGYVYAEQRGATDVGTQLGLIIQSPLKTSLHWLIALFMDTLDVVVLAWWQPLTSLCPGFGRATAFLGLGMSDGFS